MKGFKTNIEKDTMENKNFRKVVYTGKHLQLVLMYLKAGEEIGEEIHTETDQFFRIEKGEAKCSLNGHEYYLHDGDVLLVPAGSRHNVMNAHHNEDLQFYTLYAPPQHKDGTVHATREEAESREEKFDGATTEMAESALLL